MFFSGAFCFVSGNKLQKMKEANNNQTEKKKNMFPIESVSPEKNTANGRNDIAMTKLKNRLIKVEVVELTDMLLESDNSALSKNGIGPRPIAKEITEENRQNADNVE